MCATAPITPLLASAAAQLSADQSINIQYTSGTTGFPKGATLSHHNILNNGFFVGRLCRYSDRDRVCIPVPFYHCFGMTMGDLGCTTHGATMVIPAPGFDPWPRWRRWPRSAAPLSTACPPCSLPSWPSPTSTRFDLSSLRTGIMAGSPCPVEVMKQVVARWAWEVTICYGMTETSPVSTQTSGPPTPSIAASSTVGQVHPHVEVKVVDPDYWFDRAAGTAGELCTRGYSVMLGYWEQPEKTAEAIDPARWMHTGDLAVMDDEGLRQHHRAHQGHGDPGRREHLPPGDRGVPLLPSGHPGRPGDRCPRRQVRRGADGLGEAPEAAAP